MWKIPILRHSRLLLSALAGAAVALALGLSFTQHKDNDSHTSPEAQRWVERIHAVGAAEAYVEFGDSMKTVPEVDQHFRAHAFGEALYETLGAPGFSTCDEKFAYGCAHEFIAKAIHDKGVGGLTSITDSCPKGTDFGQTFGCFHGVGHGLLADSAYEAADLTRILEVCSRFGEEAKHCYDGAFMEYNMHTMLSGGATVRDPKEPFAPCDSVDTKYQRYCLFRQAQWWQVALFPGEVREQSFKKMGALCRQAKDELSLPNDDACMAGLGTTALANSLEDLERVRNLCDVGTATDHELGVCLAFAAAIRNFIYKAGDGSTLCSSLRADDLSLCLTGANDGVDALREKLN